MDERACTRRRAEEVTLLVVFTTGGGVFSCGSDHHTETNVANLHGKLAMYR